MFPQVTVIHSHWKTLTQSDSMLTVICTCVLIYKHVHSSNKHAATGSNLESHIWMVRPLLWNWRCCIDLEQRRRDSKWQSKCLQPWTPQASANFRYKIKFVSFETILYLRRPAKLRFRWLCELKVKFFTPFIVVEKRAPFSTLICCCHIHFKRQHPQADSATLRTPASTYCRFAHSHGAFVVMADIQQWDQWMHHVYLIFRNICNYTEMTNGHCCMTEGDLY